MKRTVVDLVLVVLCGALAALLGALVAATGGCVHAAQTPHRHLTLTDQERAAVSVTVWCGPDYPGDHDMWSGSGAIVSSRHVLTARHLADACPSSIPEVHVTLWNGDRYRVVWYAYLDGDAALLQRSDAGSWEWAKRPIVTSPSPHGVVCAETATPSRGRICGQVTSLHDGETLFGGSYVRYGAFTRKGNSGSAVWDRFGHLVGVHSASEPGKAYLSRVRSEQLP